MIVHLRDAEDDAFFQSGGGEKLVIRILGVASEDDGLGLKFLRLRERRALDEGYGNK
jgi:hypothetical protein